MSQQTTNRSFDELTRGLASGSISRGRALKLMGAALVGGTLASLGGVAAADDECKPVNKKCRKDAQCCSGRCDTTSRTCACREDGGPCTDDTQCCSGFCAFGARCAEPGVRISCRCVNGASTTGCAADCNTGQQEICVPFCADQGTFFAGNATCTGPVVC